VQAAGPGIEKRITKASHRDDWQCKCYWWNRWESTSCLKCNEDEECKIGIDDDEALPVWYETEYPSIGESDFYWRRYDRPTIGVDSRAQQHSSDAGHLWVKGAFKEKKNKFKLR